MVTLSIIIPTYNRAQLLTRALTSVVSQNEYTEIIVVDDAGTDNTVESVKEFDISTRIQYVRQEKNKGVNAARNRGISLAQGEWIAFLDDDDEFVSDALEKIHHRLEHVPPTINVVYFNSIIDKGNVSVHGGFQFDGGETEYDPTYEETMTKFKLRGDCKPVFRKALFDNPLYAFPETVNGYESYTMSLVARDNKGIRYVNDVSTIIHFDNTHSHVSHTAPRKSPQPLLDLHIKQLEEHCEFYQKYPQQLSEKYLTMCKLAIRAYNVKACVLYSIRFLLSKVRT